MTSAILLALSMGFLPLQWKSVEPESPFLCLEQRAAGHVYIVGTLKKELHVCTRHVYTLRGVHKCVFVVWYTLPHPQMLPHWF